MELQARTTLPAGVGTPAAARAFVRETVANADLDVEEDLTLVVSELVTTALVSGSSVVEVGLVADGGRVLIEVVEDAQPSASLTPLVDAADGIARGLMLVSRIAERWGVRRDGMRKVLWADVAVS